ncbi:MAG: right-handed parallel beta-helix repeat-containing protein [Proteobacteria bacterium]|nr:right-handed parallel beta-helix repeat-containing protein [Pseudomonadota bacterium]
MLRIPVDRGRRLARALAVAAVAGTVGLGADCNFRSYEDYEVVILEAGPGLEFAFREALITVKPGTIIQLPAGVHAFTDGLVLNTSHVVIRGRGMHDTVLDFTLQERGAEGLLVLSNHFGAQDFTIRNPVGDGLRLEGIDGVTIERVTVEWTGGPSVENGAYGIYPAQCSNVYIGGSIVRGARDAGIYLGQSHNAILEYNLAEENVLGIEIENSQDVIARYNVTTGNTAGLAVFHLPNLSVDGRRSRVYDNTVYDNNIDNFAPPGGLIALAPPGVGVFVIGNDDVEIYGNDVRDHGTANVIVSSFQVTQEGFDPDVYDPYAEGVYIHDNHVENAGYDPKGLLGIVASAIFAPDLIPDITIGGYVDGDKVPGGIDPGVIPFTQQLPEPLRICIQSNGAASFGSLNALAPPAPLFDLSPHDCTQPPLPPVAVGDPPAPPVVEDPYTPEEIAALCGAEGEGVNWDAFVVDCPELSDYRLFPDGDPRGEPSPGGVPYDLTTPLFSDYAIKDRFVFLPPGTQAQYADPQAFVFPVGTIIAKTFHFLDERTVPANDQLVETRLLIRREGGWQGLPYIWNAERTEAVLSLGGGLRAVSFEAPNGDPTDTDYAVPSAAQCGSCHLANAPIGPLARYLNRDFDYADGTRNQLAHWTAEGLLAGAPSPEAAPRLPVYDDPGDGSLEERTRTYLEMNCAHCHNPAGRARSTRLFLNIQQPVDLNYGICKPTVAAGGGAGGLTFDVVPGAPEESILLFRLASVAPAVKMPELSKSVVHTEGVDLVSDWIANLSGSCP